MVNWRTVIIGLILVIILSNVFEIVGMAIGAHSGLLVGFIGQIIGYLLATIYVGYVIEGDYITGAIYGVLVGAIGSILSIVIVGAIFGTLTTGSMGSLLIGAIFAGIVGAAGGITGFIVKVYRPAKEEPAA